LYRICNMLITHTHTHTHRERERETHMTLFFFFPPRSPEIVHRTQIPNSYYIVELHNLYIDYLLLLSLLFYIQHNTHTLSISIHEKKKKMKISIAILAVAVSTAAGTIRGTSDPEPPCCFNCTAPLEKYYSVVTNNG
jgi:hypothetical protein